LKEDENIHTLFGAFAKEISKKSVIFVKFVALLIDKMSTENSLS